MIKNVNTCFIISIYTECAMTYILMKKQNIQFLFHGFRVLLLIPKTNNFISEISLCHKQYILITNKCLIKEFV